MKKVFLIFLILTIALSLSSCTVNWFGETYEVPWYFIAIPVVLIAVFAYFILMNMTFICPYCGTEFKPKWYQLSVSVHMNGKRLAKCPSCERQSFCERKR